MKKILVLVSLLIAAAACSTTLPATKMLPRMLIQQTPTRAPKRSLAPWSPSRTSSPKEKASWDAIQKKDWDGFGKTLASDYIEILDDGVHDKASALTEHQGF
jgi:hypothetical protein